jgi:hypothetical protein
MWRIRGQLLAWQQFLQLFALQLDDFIVLSLFDKPAHGSIMPHS